MGPSWILGHTKHTVTFPRRLLTDAPPNCRPLTDAEITFTQAEIRLGLGPGVWKVDVSRWEMTLS